MLRIKFPLISDTATIFILKLEMFAPGSGCFISASRTSPDILLNLACAESLSGRITDNRSSTYKKFDLSVIL